MKWCVGCDRRAEGPGTAVNVEEGDITPASEAATSEGQEADNVLASAMPGMIYQSGCSTMHAGLHAENAELHDSAQHDLDSVCVCVCVCTDA